MREHRGDLWRLKADAYVITTNFSVRKDGQAVMGRGCALEAKQQWPDVAIILGALNRIEHKVHLLRVIREDRFLISYPVKFRWFEKAEMGLVVTGARDLAEIIDALEVKTVAMPRPGCGNGGLDWETVKPEIERLLDNRFIVCDYGNDV